MSNTENKLRGAYYTPDKICEFLSRWAIRDKKDTVLEPSCGDGAILRSVHNQLLDLDTSEANIHEQVLGIELESGEAEKARDTGAEVTDTDFFKYYSKNIDEKRKFDVCLMNPPYIRSQIVREKTRGTAFQLMEKYGLHPNRLTNIWVPFVVLSSLALTDNGRIGMVIPAEIMTVQYAAETRKFLTGFFDRLTLITFKSLVFNDIQQEVVLLLGEKQADIRGMRVIELNDLNDFDKDELSWLEGAEIKEYRDDDKWITYLLTNEERSLLRRLADDDSIETLSDLATINVGLVTGKNDYFILSHKDVQKHRLERNVRPIIVRSNLIKGCVLTREDFQKLDRSGAKIYLFSPRLGRYGNMIQSAKDYIAYGEERGYNKPYKCRIRKPWYQVPITWTADAFLPMHCNAYPRMILNPEGICGTDNLVKVRFRERPDPKPVVAAFLNSYTLALSETIGRAYGGGVLELMPGEMRRLRVPLTGAEKLDLNLIDAWQREGEIQKILDYADNILLEEGLGLTEHEIMVLRGIWEKLRDRRLGRRKNNKRD